MLLYNTLLFFRRLTDYDFMIKCSEKGLHQTRFMVNNYDYEFWFGKETTTTTDSPRLVYLPHMHWSLIKFISLYLSYSVIQVVGSHIEQREWKRLMKCKRKLRMINFQVLEMCHHHRPQGLLQWFTFSQKYRNYITTEHSTFELK